MKNYKKICVVCLMVIYLSGCDTAGGIDSFVSGDEAAIASWVSAPKGSLRLSNDTSSLSFEVEFLDGADGSSVEAYSLVAKDGSTNTGTIVTSTSFTTNKSGRFGLSESFDFRAIYTALGTTLADYTKGAKFTLTSLVTVNGVVYESGLSNQLFKAATDVLTVPDEVVKIKSSSVNRSFSNTGRTDTVTLDITNDLKDSLTVLPIITRISAQGNTDDVVGQVQRALDKKGKDSVYWFTYKPGMATRDTISFLVSGASALSRGFVMKDETLNGVFIVDNIPPTVIGNASDFVRTPAGDRIGYRFNYLFSEDIGEIKITQDFLGVDDDKDKKIDENTGTDKDAVKVTSTFKGNLLDWTFDWVPADGQVTFTVEIEDVAGNTLDLGTLVLTP